MAGITKLKLTNATHSPIIFTVGSAKGGDPANGVPPTFADQVAVPPMNIGQPVIVEGDLAEALQKDSGFKWFTDNKMIIVNRDATLGEERRAPTEPVAPKDLIEASTPGADVAHVQGLQTPLKVTKLEIQ